MHPLLVTEVKDLYLNKIVPSLKGSVWCRFAYTLRTFDEQNVLYAQGRTTLFDRQGKRLGVVTNAKGGQSFHNYGLALDIVLIDGRSAYWDVVKDFDSDGEADWMEIVHIFQNAGWTWGNSWGDNPHFEKTFGYEWGTLLTLHNHNEFIPGTQYVNI